MIFASFSSVKFTRSYKLFCTYMDIPRGVGAGKLRTPAESRTVRQFLLAVNTNRRAVFVNFNSGLAVVVERHYKPYGEWAPIEEISLPEGIETIRWELAPFKFMSVDDFVPKIDHLREALRTSDPKRVARLLQAKK